MRKQSSYVASKQRKKSVALSLTQSNKDLQSFLETQQLQENYQHHYYTAEIDAEIQHRNEVKVMERVKGDVVDMTPRPITSPIFVEKFTNYKRDLGFNIAAMHSPFGDCSTKQSKHRASLRPGIGGMKQSIDDLMAGIAIDTIHFDESEQEKEPQEYKPLPYKKSFIKITLRKSDFFVLHSQCSSTVAKGTSEGDDVEKDNKYYEYLTVGKGKVRRRSDNEAQTETLLTMTRSTNTIMVTYATVGSYVSKFEMYDTVHNLITKFDELNPTPSLLNVDEYIYLDDDDDNEFDVEESEKKQLAEKLMDSVAFKDAIMHLGRALSSNLYEKGIRRFRNFNRVDRCSTNVVYNYGITYLFRCSPVLCKMERKAVCDICFCTSNSDIFVVAYGLYSFTSQQVPDSGDVYVWSIKNPNDPERNYNYKVPVTAVKFSPFLPSLIAIGLYDGTVEVRDITHPVDPPIAVSQRSTSPGCAPVVSIVWIKQAESTDVNEIDPFLTLSQDGSVTRFRIIKSPYLLGFNQMTLERIEGRPEGLNLPVTPSMGIESNRHPQGLYITTHPVQKDIYYVLTDEGCIHKCSINYQHQYLEVLRCHDGPVNVMKFSPWSPKIFLTAGNDWYIRIWIDGITRPLIELIDEFCPVHWADWSTTHSTIIVSVNLRYSSTWDIKRNILKPMSKNRIEPSINTTAEFSNSGTVLAVGNERGNVVFNALDNMPFAPHFQYDDLERSIYKAVGNNEELAIELKSIGFFGYPNKKKLKEQYDF